MNTLTSLKTLLAAGLLALISGAASASTFTFEKRFEGDNDCSGAFGQGFENCTYDNSPIIAKIDFGNAGQVLQLNTKVFPNLDASMFSATMDGNSATFTYDTTSYGGGDGVLLRYVVLKNGNGFDLFRADQPGFFFSNITLTSSVKNDISHISFYDTLAPIPLPAAGFLLLGALGGMGLLARRRRMAV